MTTTRRKKRIPQLKYTTTRNLGWHCSYRDQVKGTPRKMVFGMVPKGEAEVAYHRWLGEHLGDQRTDLRESASPLPSDNHQPIIAEPRVIARRRAKPQTILQTTSGGSGGEGDACMDGCLLLVANGLIAFEQARVREQGAPRAKGTISEKHFRELERYIKNFLRHLNTQHGQGCLTRMSLADLLMSDVESYNKAVVDEGHSVSVVQKQMQAVKLLIDRAGRPEFGQQVLPWNWQSRDVFHGKAQTPRKLPTLEQLQKLLEAADLRGQTMIWMGIGLGFGQSDLAAVCIRHIDAQSYDMRRGKTGIDRYGETPPRVWAMVRAYLNDCGHSRAPDGLMFTTMQGKPLVHDGTDAVKQWWNRLRQQIGETSGTLGGFYTLRHLGATEFGSRPGTSIGEMKRWLGHAASSHMADVYMRPVSPEHREVVEFVRSSLATPLQLSAA